jgi:GntR family transcriptional regulator/MocR family aminotransferase
MLVRDVVLAKDAAEPLYQQLYTQLRSAIAAGGQWAAGTRLPSSRELAGDLGVSRNTVVLAYQRLQEDGFVRGMAGGGTVVGELPAVPPPRDGGASAAAVEPAPYGLPNAAFPVGVPPVDLFPAALWAGLTSRRLRTSGVRVLLGPGLLGYRPLREAIAGYLWVVRGIRCTPEQVIVTRGLDAGLALLGKALLRDGDRVWCEEPGYRPDLARHGARCHPVPVDEDGLDVDTAAASAPDAALALVSPVRQLPMSVALSESRRARLLDHAHRAGMWVVEHEHDTAFLGQQAARPLIADDDRGRVIHVGSFDTVLFPQLHVGYCVVPDGLIDTVGRAVADADAQASGLTQAVLADFLNHHRFARFLARITSACASRRELLRDALSRLPDTPLTVVGDAGRGSYLTTVFRRPATESGLLADAARLSLNLVPLSRYVSTANPITGLLLGCAAAREEAIGAAVRQLGSLLRRHVPPALGNAE